MRVARRATSRALLRGRVRTIDTPFPAAVGLPSLGFVPLQGPSAPRVSPRGRTTDAPRAPDVPTELRSVPFHRCLLHRWGDLATLRSRSSTLAVRPHRGDRGDDGRPWGPSCVTARAVTVGKHGTSHAPREARPMQPFRVAPVRLPLGLPAFRREDTPAASARRAIRVGTRKTRG